MSYLSVLLVMVVPPCLLLAVPGGRGLARFGRRGVLAIPVVACLAVIYTTPWDNYLIWRGVWNSPDGRILARLGYVPVEEYVFFLLQPVLTGLWFGAVIGRRALGPPSLEPWDPGLGGVLMGAAVFAAGVILWLRPETLYLGALLAWTALPLTGMWLYRGRWLARRTALLVAAVGPPTAYLRVVDRVAIAQGAWAISDAHILPVRIGGLPVEEVLFFLVTNLLVVLGMALILEPGADVDPAGDAVCGSGM